MSEQQQAPSAETTPVFDPTRNLRIKLPFSQKQIRLRWPDDETWRQYDRKVRAVSIPRGDGKTEMRVENIDAAAEWLIKKVQIGAPDGEQTDLLSPSEAAWVVGKLQRADASEAHRAGEHFEIAMTVFGGVDTVHSLRVPSLAHTRRYGDFSTLLTGRRGRREVESDLADAGTLYDELANGNGRGYAAGKPVPLIHKASALAELMTAAAEVIDQEGEEGFF